MGNRQQSRFLALVSNCDRYLEVSNAAAESEDAGLLQYSKTLDSLETKLNNISTSFQQFYMSILNGPFFGSVLDFVNNLIKGLNKLGNFSSIFNILGIAKSVKTVATTVVNTFSSQTNTLRSNIKNVFAQITSDIVAAYRKAGVEGGRAHVQAFQQAVNGQNAGAQSPQQKSTAPAAGMGKWSKAVNALALGGAITSTIGTGMAGNNAVGGSLMSLLGSAASYGAQGASMGMAVGHPLAGAIIGGVVGIFSQIPGVINAYANQAQEALDKAKENAEEKNLERAEAAERARNLEATLENLEKLKKARYDSEEAQKEYIDASNQAFEQFPELLAYFDEAGNAIIEASNAEDLLINARKKAAQAAIEAAAAERDAANEQLIVDRNKANSLTFGSASDTLGQRPLDIGWRDYFKNSREEIEELEKISFRSDLTEAQKYFEIIEKIRASEGDTRKDLENWFNSTLNQAMFNEGVMTNKAATFFQNNLGFDERANYILQETGPLMSALESSTISLKAADRATVLRTIDKDVQELNDYKDISWQDELAGATELLQKKVLETITNSSKLAFDSEGNLTTEAQQEIETVVSDLYDNFSELYTTLSETGQVEDFSSLIQSAEKGQLTIQQVSSQFQTIFGENPINWDQAAYDYLRDIADYINQQGDTLKQSLRISDRQVDWSKADEISTDVASTFFDEIINFANSIDNRIKEGTLTAAQGQEIVDAYSELLISTSDLSAEQAQKAQEILTQSDLSTTLGQVEAIQKLAKEGIEGIDVASIPTYAENLVTQYGSLTEKLATDLQNMSKALEKAVSGMDYEDAAKVGNQLGEAVLDVFDFSSGKYFIKDIEDLKKLYTEEGQGKVNALNTQLGEYVQLLEKAQTSTISDEEFADILMLRNQYGTSAKQWYKEQYGKDYIGTIENVISQYLTYIMNSSTEAITQEENYILAKFDASKVATGEMSFDEFKDKWDNSYNYLLDQAQWSLEQTIDSFASSIYSLGQEIGSNNKSLTAADLNKLLANSGLNIAEEQLTQEILSKLATAFSEGDIQTIDELLTTVTGIDISKAQATEWGEIFQSGLTSGTAEYAKSLANYYLQIISGELQVESIQDEGLREILSNFKDHAETQFETLLTTLSGAYSGNFEKISSGMAEAYTSRLDAAHPETSIAKTLAEPSRMTNDQLGKFLGELSTVTGLTYDFNQFATYDSRDQSWQLDIAKAKKELTEGAGEYANEAVRQQILKQLDYLEDWETEAKKTEAYSTLQEFSTQQEITAESIQKLYAGFNKIIDVETARTYAETIQSFDPLQRLEEMAKFLKDEGVVIDPAKYQELVSLVFDSIVSSIENGLSALSSGIAGTLDASTYNTLRQKYGLSGAGRMTATGIQLDAAEQKDLIAALYGEAEQSGMLQGFGEQLWDSLKNSQESLFKGYTDIEEELDAIDDVGSKWLDKQGQLTKEGQAYAAALQQARAAAILDENSYEFSFMDQEVAGGLTKNFDNFVNQIDSVKNAFSSFESEGTVTYDTFLNLFDFINRYGAGTEDNLASFAGILKQSGKDYETFVRSVLENTSKWGEVDIGAVAAQLGISVDSAMTMMSDSMSGGLKEIANQQVDYLNGLENMLMAMQSLEEVGQIETGIDFTFSIDGQSETFDTIEKAFEYYTDLTDTEQKARFRIEFDQYIKTSGDESQKELLDFITGGQPLTEQGFFAFDYLAKNVDFSAITEQQATQLAALLSPGNLDNLLTDKNGEVLSEWQKVLESEFQSIFGVGIPQKLQQIVKDGITIDGMPIQVTTSGTQLEFTNIGNFDENTIREQLNQQLAAQGLEVDKLTTGDGGLTYTVTVKTVSEEGQIDVDAEEAQKKVTTLQEALDILNATVATPSITINDQASAVLNSIISKINQINGTPTGASVKAPNITKSDKFVRRAMLFSGTANDITGPAFAGGSVGKLIAGAQLAQKTLVGELGPELAVYNGQYHLLGQSGAEFVDIPKDAIIFNHLQTAGIISGQMKDARGKPLTPGSAMVTGNVKGPAAAGGISSALSSVRRAKSIWQGLLNSLTAAELAGGGSGGGGGGGGGGSGNTIKAVVEELEEWYNLSRQIANLEQEINNIVAERENIADGSEYLRNLREEQKLLRQQETTQQTLLEYQKLQLRRQANQINQNRIWSQFLTVDESGLLQYVKGNETNGGKGALQVLQQLNEMSGQEQIDFLKKLGYSYTTNEGEALEGTELVEQFFQELQDQIDQYDALYDTVHETQQTLEELETSIEDINEEIKQNQMDLESAIYDIIVKAWETEIDQMKKQTDIIKDANDAYINGLNEALSSERDLYSRNQDISDREQLQRQLSLLRRSGGSASQIADLEKQLDSMLQDEYFNNQQEMIEGIQSASEEQVRKLQEQITIQEEALQYQKENGIIWTKVYEVMSGSAAEILAFMQGNSVDFFSQSLLQQEQMLTDWAKKIGIYTEDRVYNNYADFARTNIWDTGSAWQYGNLSNYQGLFNSLSPEDQVKLKEQYASVYAGARMNGLGNEDAAKQAAENLYNTLRQRQQQQTATQAKAPTTAAAPASAPAASSSGGGGSSSSRPANKKVSLSVRAGDGHGSPTLSTTSASPGQTVTVSPRPSTGYQFSYLTYNGVRKNSTSITPSGAVASISIVVYYKAKNIPVSSGMAKLLSQAKNNKVSGFSEGGLADYTGIAMVHGTKKKPEGFLNAEQTAQIREGLKLAGSSRVLDDLRQVVGRLDSTIKNVAANNTTTETSTFTVAPGAVTIQVAQLNDSYDVEELSNDILNRMVSIASKSTNRGVSRR